MLQLLGLDAVSETVYRDMLAHPQDGVALIGRRLGLSSEDVRSALDRLSELALVRSAADDSGGLHAVDPHLGMEILLARQQAELAAQQQRVEASRAAAAKLLSEFAHQGQASSGEQVVYLEGLDSIRDYLASLNRDVEEELVAFAPGGPQTAANMHASRPLNRQLLERGVRMRTIYLDSIRNDAATVSHAEWLTSLGGSVRTAPSLPTRLIICDRRVALIAADHDDTAAGAVVVRTEGVVAALCALFESVWATADPLGAPPGPEAARFTRQQAEALRLLAQGLTDEAIAKRLGVSGRTARRIATEVMSRLQARSRFQAGVLAVQQGHLPSSPD